MRFRLIATSVLCAAGITACSPYNYSSEVGDLNTSVSGLTSSVTSGHQSVVDDAASSRRRELIYNQRAVAISPECAARPGTVGKNPPPCSIYRFGDKAPTDPEPIPEKLNDTLAALKNYTAALAAVTKASDRADFDAAVGKLSTAISGLIGAVPGTGTVAAPVVAAGINLFGWVVGTGLDQQRFDTLRNAVNLVDRGVGPNNEKPMDVISALLDRELSALALKRRSTLIADEQLVRSKIVPGVGEETYRARFADLESIVSELDTLRKSDPAGAAQALAKAHKALVDAVNSPKPDLAGLVKTIGDFKDKVSKLQSALTAATASTTSTKKGS